MSAPGPSLRRPDRRPRAYRFAVGVESPRLISEVDGGVRVEAPRQDPPSRVEQLVRTHALPLNLRWARRAAESLLLADIPARARDGASALVAAIEHGQWVVERTLVPFDVDALRTSFVGAGLAINMLLSRSASLELRWPIEGVVRATRIAATADEWVVDCVALERLGVAPDVGAAVGADDEVVADQALRVNAHVRYARLALDAGAVVAQARVPRQAETSEFLIRSARAVAALAHHAAFGLTTLQENPEVRAAYARLIPVPQPPTQKAKENP